jgi:hypothetical protein
MDALVLRRWQRPLLCWFGVRAVSLADWDSDRNDKIDIAKLKAAAEG